MSQTMEVMMMMTVMWNIWDNSGDGDDQLKINNYQQVREWCDDEQKS